MVGAVRPGLGIGLNVCGGLRSVVPSSENADPGHPVRGGVDQEQTTAMTQADSLRE